MSLNELYREVILDHYRAPRHHEHLDAPDATAEGKNPLCGDEVTIEVELDGDAIKAIGAIGVGCSISQASASMMTEAVVGKDRKEVETVDREGSGWSWYGRLSAAWVPVIVGFFAFAFLAGCVAALTQVF